MDRHHECLQYLPSIPGRTVNGERPWNANNVIPNPLAGRLSQNAPWLIPELSRSWSIECQVTPIVSNFRSKSLDVEPVPVLSQIERVRGSIISPPA